MVDAKFIIKVFAVGFPALLLVVGLVIYSGASFVNTFFDASEQISFGRGLIIISILIYLMELIIFIMIWYSENQSGGYY